MRWGSGPRPIVGPYGSLEWGYFKAASVGKFTARQCADGTWSLRGTVIVVDAFKINQKPLVFVAPHAHGEWRWPVRSVDLGPGQGPRELRATLGAQLPEIVTK